MMATPSFRRFSFLMYLLAVFEQAKGQCDAVELVSRQQWGARPPVRTTPLHLPVNMTFIHHSAGLRCYTLEECSGVIRAIQDYHIYVRGWYDIGYSFLVGNDGRVYEGRGWRTLPAHAPHYNAISHGICILGDYMEVAPLPDALKATQAWIQCGVDKKYILADYELFGHRDGRCTECPGDVLYDIIRTWPHYSTRHIPVVCGCQSLVSSIVLIITCSLFSGNF